MFQKQQVARKSFFFFKNLRLIKTRNLNMQFRVVMYMMYIVRELRSSIKMRRSQKILFLFNGFISIWFGGKKQKKVLLKMNEIKSKFKLPLYIAHSHENGSSSSFFVLWSNNPCSLHKICNRVNFLLDLDKIYTDIYSFLYFWLQIHTTFAPQRPKNT